MARRVTTLRHKTFSGIRQPESAILGAISRRPDLSCQRQYAPACAGVAWCPPPPITQREAWTAGGTVIQGSDCT
jgi:hypothetical protein